MHKVSCWLANKQLHTCMYIHHPVTPHLMTRSWMCDLNPLKSPAFEVSLGEPDQFYRWCRLIYDSPFTHARQRFILKSSSNKHACVNQQKTTKCFVLLKQIKIKNKAILEKISSIFFLLFVLHWSFIAHPPAAWQHTSGGKVHVIVCFWRYSLFRFRLRLCFALLVLVLIEYLILGIQDDLGLKLHGNMPLNVHWGMSAAYGGKCVSQPLVCKSQRQAKNSVLCCKPKITCFRQYVFKTSTKLFDICLNTYEEYLLSRKGNICFLLNIPLSSAPIRPKEGLNFSIFPSF